MKTPAQPLAQCFPETPCGALSVPTKNFELPEATAWRSACKWRGSGVAGRVSSARQASGQAGGPRLLGVCAKSKNKTNTYGAAASREVRAVGGACGGTGPATTDLAVGLALEDGEAVHVRSEAAREQRVAVEEQVVRCDGRRHAGPRLRRSACRQRGAAAPHEQVPALQRLF